MILGHRIHRRRDGRFQIRLTPPERSLLAALPSQARVLLDMSDPSTVRLFPPAYPGSPDAEADYRALIGKELLRRHAGGLEMIASTADAEELDEEQLQQWLAGLQVLRLVLGTQLDVAEDGTAGSSRRRQAAGGDAGPYADSSAGEQGDGAEGDRGLEGSEEVDSHRADDETRLAVYRYLSMLQAEVIDNLSSRLPARGRHQGP